MKKTYFFLAAFLIAGEFIFGQQQMPDTLLKNFQQPPNSAKPRVWWHWMNGNITKEGIRKDLLWMQRAGIAGFQNFDAAFETPQIVSRRLSYMTPEWKDAFNYATKLADSLKLEMAIAGSPGWSESGGSWVPVEDGMKKIVWTETRVRGGQNNIRLPQAPASSGTFQNMPLAAHLSNQQEKLPTLYRDVAVIAFPLPAAERVLSELRPKVESSGGSFSLKQLTDGDLSKEVMLPANTKTGKAWISFTFEQPQTIKAITIMGGGDKGFLDRNGDLTEARSFQVSDNGVDYKHVVYLPAGETLQQTFALPATTGRYFRVTFNNLPGNMNDPNPGTPIAELVLHSITRVHHFEDKAAFTPAPRLLHTVTQETTDTIALEQVVDLTGKMSADGSLNWTAPSGNWCILRMGYTVMAITNHPATIEATGFEVDKMDAAAIKRYFTHYLNMYKEATGGLMGAKGGLQFMVTDSWEAGAQNWTPKMFDEFQQRRGYSLRSWMPALAGYVIGSASSTDKFLYDFRRTLSDMVSEYHYDQLTEILASEGMKRYSESHELKRAMIADGMDAKRYAAVPMSAIWTPNVIINQNDQNGYISDIRESASVAHIYGQNLVAAESFSALAYPDYAWSYCPENLKPTADLALASGLNRFVVHCSPHQPSDSLFPGLTLGPFGQWFTRHEAWAEQAKVWTEYLSRSSYLLQQGKFVADIVYYYGEDDNITSIFRRKQPVIPEGYNYDYINTDALLRLLTVKNGRLITPSGMSYSMLVLDSNARRMPMEVLNKIEELIKGGAVVTGIKPEAPTGLKDDETLFHQKVQSLFGGNYSKVFTGIPIHDAVKQAKVAKDFDYTAPLASVKLLYVHRQLGDQDIYWVNNRTAITQQVKANFRVTGKVPEIWHPETGEVEQASYEIGKEYTTVDLSLSPNDAVFIVFRNKAKQKRVFVSIIERTTLMDITGSWEVSFQPGRGAPAKAVFETLAAYTANANDGIKYFSGTATYNKIFTLPATTINSNQQLWLDLGEVKNLASIKINGKELGIVWKTPFIIDISSAVRAGENQLEIQVTNIWVNRLIGDQQPGVTKKITYTPEIYYGAQSQLLPAGLLGPVKILQAKKQLK